MSSIRGSFIFTRQATATCPYYSQYPVAAPARLVEPLGSGIEKLPAMIQVHEDLVLPRPYWAEVNVAKGPIPRGRCKLQCVVCGCLAVLNFVLEQKMVGPCEDVGQTSSSSQFAPERKLMKVYDDNVWRLFCFCT